MAEGRSATPTSNLLIVNYFLSFKVFTPHFAPQKILSINPFKGHYNFISGVTNTVSQSAWRFFKEVEVKRNRSAAFGSQTFDGLAGTTDYVFIN